MKKELIAYLNPKSPLSEVFRTLRTNLQFTNINKKSNIVLVTSSEAGEGKSWTSSNLAIAFAQAECTVLLIDGDMRKGRVYNMFDLSPRPGLSDFLIYEEDDPDYFEIQKYIQKTKVENLFVITAGTVPPNPSELLVRKQMNNLLRRLKDAFDIIIIDGTPCSLVTDSIILSRVADSTLIVSAYGTTKKEDLKNTVKMLQNVGAHISGIVLNKTPKSKRYSQSYYYAAKTETKRTRSRKRDIKGSDRENYIVNIETLKKQREERENRKSNSVSDTNEILKKVKKYLDNKWEDGINL